MGFQVLIRRACRAVGKKEARRVPDVLTLLSRIISSNNAEVDQETKDAAEDLLVFLCTEEEDVQEIRDQDAHIEATIPVVEATTATDPTAASNEDSNPTVASADDH